MTDCAPVVIGLGLKTALETARDAGSFSLRFDCRASLGDFQYKLSDDAPSTPLVDIVVQPGADVDLSGRYEYDHTVPVVVGLRRRLSSGMRTAGSFDLSEMAPLLNLFYELIEFLLPSEENPMGRRMTGDALYATLAGKIEIVQLFDRDLLETAKQYCGIFRVPFLLKASGMTGA